MIISEGSIIDAPTSEFPKRSFEIKKKLGSGGEGYVYLAKPQNWDKQFDVALKFSNSIKETELQFIQQLIELQKSEEQQPQSQAATNIIRIYDTFKHQFLSIQVMEVGSANLFIYMKENHHKLNNLQKFKICLQLLKAINFIHLLGLIHRDIKGENFILVKEEFKLIDFGLISINERLMTQKQGTRIFQAPEMFEQEGQYTQSLDIWALGCVFYEIIKGEELFPCMTMDKSIQLIKEHKINQNYVYSSIDRLNVCLEWKELLKQMLNPKQFNRIQIGKAIEKVKFCIAKEQNSDISSLEPQDYKSKQQNEYYYIQQNDFDKKLQEKQQEFDKVIYQKDRLIKQLQTKISEKDNEQQQQQDQIESLQRQVEKLERKKAQQQAEIENLEQQKKQQEEHMLQQQQNQYQQIYNQLTTQFNQQFNQQLNQQLNSERQNMENEIKNYKIKIQSLEQKNEQLQKQVNQIKDVEKTSEIIKNTNQEIIFLDKIIGDLTNEISNLKKQSDMYKNIQSLLNYNNTLLNNQIIDIDQQIKEKQKCLENYETIKQEIQGLDQFKQQQEATKIAPLQEKSSTQQIQSLQSNIPQILIPFRQNIGVAQQMQQYNQYAQQPNPNLNMPQNMYTNYPLQMYTPAQAQMWNNQFQK